MLQCHFRSRNHRSLKVNFISRKIIVEHITWRLVAVQNQPVVFTTLEYRGANFGNTSQRAIRRSQTKQCLRRAI